MSTNSLTPIWTPADARALAELASQYPREIADSQMLADLVDRLPMTGGAEMRPRKLRRTLALMVFGGILAGTGIGWGTGIAKADGVISDTEYAYIQAFGSGAVCPTLDDFPSEPGVLGVMRGIMDDGFAADSAVDIINASVQDFCPRHWPLLQRIGAKARGETARFVA